MHLQPPPPSAYTQPYTAEGYFTGVRSSITIQRSPGLVYDSLSRDLHKIFGPITVRPSHYNLLFVVEGVVLVLLRSTSYHCLLEQLWYIMSTQLARMSPLYSYFMSAL